MSAHHLVVALLAAVTMLLQVTGIGVASGPIVGNYNVGLLVIRSGHVDVVDSLGQLNCDQVSVCTLSAPVGSSITLTATAAPGWTFTGWSGLGCSTTRECTFDLMPGDDWWYLGSRVTAVAQPEGVGTGVSLAEFALPVELQGGRPTVHDISADGRFLLYSYTAADYSIIDQIRWHDRSTGEDVVLGSDPYLMPSMSADGRYVALTSDANSVLLWDASTREQTLVAAAGTRPSMDATGRFISYWWSSTAYSLDRDTGQVVSRPTPWLPVMAPDASTMVVPQGNQVELIDPVSGALQASFQVPYTFMPIRVSANGAFAYGLTNNAPADQIGVSRLDLATGELIRVPRSVDSGGCSGYRSNLTAPDDGASPYFTTWSGSDGTPFGPLSDGQHDYYGIYRASFDAGVGGATSASGITLPIPQPSNDCASVVATPDGSTVIFATERLLPTAAPAPAASGASLAPAATVGASTKLVLARRDVEPGAIVPLLARRLVDTRAGQLGELEKPSGRIGSDVSARLAPGVPVRWIVAGSAGIPAESAAIAVNVTAVGPSANGNLRIYQCESESSAPPVVSTVNFRAGVTQANSAITPIATDGGLCVMSTAAADVVVDISGYVPSGEQFTALESPTRLVDTRAGRVGALEKPGEPVGSDVAVRLAAGVPVRWRMTGSAGIPADVAALAVNVTVVNPSASGNLRVYPCESRSSTPPVVSNVNFIAAVTIANSSIAATAADGGICFLSTASVDVAVDAAGYFSTTSSLSAVAPPVRLVDTRSGRVGALEKSGAVPGFDVSLRLAAGVPFRIVVGGAAGIPTSALLVALNLTAVSPAASGNLRVYGCTSTATGVPKVSNLNFRAGVTMANSAIVGLASNGGLCLYSSSSIHVVVDAAAFVT